MEEQTPKRGRGGRPKAAPGELRGAPIGVRVNGVERAEIERKAAQCGMTPAEFLRAVGMEYEVRRAVPQVNREAYQELARTAANLNRVVALINSGRPVGIGEGLAKQMLEDVQALRRELLGVKERQDRRQTGAK